MLEAAANQVETDMLPPDSQFQFELLAFRFGQELIRFPRNVLAETTREDRDSLTSNLFAVGANYIQRTAARIDIVYESRLRGDDDEMDFESMSSENAYTDVRLALMAINNSTNLTLRDKWLRAILETSNGFETIPSQPPASILLMSTTSQLTNTEESHLWQEYFATANIPYLAKITSRHRYAVNVVSAALLESRGIEGLQEYWDKLAKDYYFWTFLQLIPWADKYGMLKFLFHRWHNRLEGTFRKCLESVYIHYIIDQRLSLCEAYFQTDDYLSVIIIIEQLIKSFGAFPEDLSGDTTKIEALHDLLSKSYAMTSLTARVLQFITYEPFTLSPIKWYTEFGAIYGYDVNYSNGFDILGASRSTSDLWNVSNWSMKKMLECLAAYELYDEALDYCQKALSECENEDDPFTESRIFYYIASIHKSSGDIPRAYQVCQEALGKFPTAEIVPEFRKLLDSCWQELDAQSRPPSKIPGYPHGYYFPLDNEEYFRKFIGEDVFLPWERFRDFRALQVLSKNNILGNLRSRRICDELSGADIYRKQAEFHQLVIPSSLNAGNDVSEWSDWMSGKVDELANDKEKFPDWLVGRSPAVRYLLRNANCIGCNDSTRRFGKGHGKTSFSR